MNHDWATAQPCNTRPVTKPICGIILSCLTSFFEIGKLVASRIGSTSGELNVHLNIWITNSRRQLLSTQKRLKLLNLLIHITPILRSLHWLKINERIEYKLLSLTYKVLTTSQPDYLHNLISVQSTGKTRSSSLVILARPSVSSSLQITNRSLKYASPYLWNQLPSSLRQPHSVHSPPGSPHPAHITSPQLPPSLSSPITVSTFHSRLKTHLFHKSFPP